MKCKLYLIRHGQSTYNLENRFTGWKDVDLTDLGKSQAIEASKLLSGYNFDLAFTSNLLRAQKTLDIIKMINDEKSYCCIQAERALLEAIGGDCDTAVGGLAKLLNEKIVLKSELFSNDGNKKFVAENSGSFKEARAIGYKVGKALLEKAGPDFTTQGN